MKLARTFAESASSVRLRLPGGPFSQLRGQDIETRGGIHAMRITPEAGSVKTNVVRIVPLHEDLIAQGFLDFVKSRGTGPLFYNPDAKDDGKATDPRSPQRPRAVKTRERLAGWVRELGVTDKGVRPNHAWRHTFKQIAERCGISERVSDATQATRRRRRGAVMGAPRSRTWPQHSPNFHAMMFDSLNPKLFTSLHCPARLSLLDFSMTNCTQRMGPKMKDCLCIMHLSDLHFAGSDKADTKIVIDALIKDIDSKISDGTTFDFIVFSGDLVQAGGNRTLFREAKTHFIDRLAAASHVPEDRIIFCPGNHDIDRDLVKKDDWVEAGLLATLRGRNEINAFIDNNSAVEISNAVPAPGLPPEKWSSLK